MVKIVYVGFGIVSQGLAEIILNNNSVLPLFETEEIQTVGILDTIKGSKIDASGINMHDVLLNAKEGDYSLLTDTIFDIPKAIQEINADILIEASFTDIKTGQPAISHMESVLKSNKHVVTTNKGPFAVAYKQIFNLAALLKKNVVIEGTVMSGTPIINVLNNGLLGSDITAVSGIMNGTSNYILSSMDKDKLEYKDSLYKAKKLGYAEANPTSDLNGEDVASKLKILTALAFNSFINNKLILVEGIKNISKRDIINANILGYKITKI